MIIAVVDGMGGGIGAQIVAQLRQELPLEVEILALGTNSTATQKMMKARASRGASGENAIRVSINQADVVLGPIGVVVPNSMMGEITPSIAESVAMARAVKLLLPLNHPHLEVVGVEPKPLTRLIGQAIETIKARFPSSLSRTATSPGSKGDLDTEAAFWDHGPREHDALGLDRSQRVPELGS